MKKYISRLKKFLVPLIIIGFIFILPTKVLGDIKFPSPTSLKYINDYVGILDKETQKYIVSVGNELEKKTGAQSVIVIVNSLQGYDARDYGNKLFREWHIGEKNKNNGLLTLVSIQDKKWSIEVGKGLEGVIPDTLSKRVMESEATNNFKNGNYDEGLKRTYSIFADMIGKEYGATLEKNENINYDFSKNEHSINPIYIYIILGLLAIDFVFNRGRVLQFILELLLWNSFFGGKGPKGPMGGSGNSGNGGGFGGFGGGTSGGGGSSGSW